MDAAHRRALRRLHVEVPREIERCRVEPDPGGLEDAILTGGAAA